MGTFKNWIMQNRNRTLWAYQDASGEENGDRGGLALWFWWFMMRIFVRG